VLLYNPSVAAGMRCHLVGRDPTLLASPAADEIVEDVLEGLVVSRNCFSTRGIRPRLRQRAKGDLSSVIVVSSDLRCVPTPHPTPMNPW
jgi:hypothetical protein